jgi:NADPH:quinone reductase-like Zn-dependent oxidoreductase
MAGDVVAVGKAVTRLAVGDRVFGLPVTGCHAEYRAVRATGPIARIPDGVSYEGAAALPFGATTALSFLTRSKLQRGDTLLVNGASGAVGVATLQIARSMGIATVAVCSAPNHELVLSLGATRAIDYRDGAVFAPGDAYDGVMDTVGNLSLAAVAPYLTAKGAFLGVVGMPGPADFPYLLRGKRVVGGMAVGSAALMEQVARLVAAGSLKAVVGQHFTFADLPTAHAYVDGGHKVGTAVVSLD